MNQDHCDGTIANFIQKSFEILQNKQYEHIIYWLPLGKEFAIKEIELFQNQILPKYFRHRNINSFIRQLNMYGFHKSRKDPSKNIFSHPFFQKGQPELLPMVKRKVKNDDKAEEDIKIPSTNVFVTSKKLKSHEEIIDETKKKAISISSIVLKEEHTLKQMEENKQNKQNMQIRRPRQTHAPPKIEVIVSAGYLSIRQFEIPMSENSPFKGLIEKSQIMENNFQVYFKLKEHDSVEQNEQIHDEDDDNISIEDEIERDRRIYQNRLSGVSILQTCNLLKDF